MQKGIKSLEHGSIGEARTKEILIDRFWILERSVDTDGADFIIQKRLTNLTGIEPARLGIVQAKFRENINSEILIKEEYVRDDYGNVKNEFFLIIHTGKEDEKEKYFLTADNIIESFSFKEGSFRIKNLKGSEFKEDSSANILGEIENLLKNVEVVNNQEFVYRYITGKVEEIKDIKQDYDLFLLETDNNIIDATQKYKEKLSGKLSELLNGLNPIATVIKSNDPINILGELNDFGEIDNLVVENIKDVLNEINNLSKDFYKDNKDSIRDYVNCFESLNQNTILKIKSFKDEMRNLLFMKIKGVDRDEVRYFKVALEPKRTKTQVEIYGEGKAKDNAQPFITFIEYKDKKHFYFKFTWEILGGDLDITVNYILESIFEKVIPNFVKYLEGE